MRVGINGRIFFKPGSGIVRYSFELTQSLTKYHPENEYIVYIYKYSKPMPKFEKGIKIKELSLPYVLWRTPLFTKILDHDKIDVFHSMSYSMPFITSRFRKVKMVASFHGLQSEYFKNQTGHFFEDLKQSVYWILNYRTASYFSDRLITVSDTLAQEIHEKYHKPLDLIDTVFFGVNDELKPVDSDVKPQILEHLSNKYNIPKEYVAYIGGGLDQNKNLNTILEAFALLKQRGNNLTLVVTRVDTSLISSDLERLGLEEGKDVIGIKWLDESDLASLYSCAIMEVYPSLYEGFGFPIIEAMKCGTPVITSGISAMPEAAGEAALLIRNPKDPEEWATKISLLSGDLALQDKLRELGIVRSKKFTWSRVADDTIASYSKSLTRVE